MASVKIKNRLGQWVDLVLDNVTSDSIYQALSAHQGKLLAQGKADKATTLSGYGITNAYTKTEIDALVSAVFKYKGVKATVADVEAVVDPRIGDVWFVTADGSEYAWNGTVWEKLGPIIDLSHFLTQISIAGLILDTQSTTITKDQLLTALGVYTKAEVDTMKEAVDEHLETVDSTISTDSETTSGNPITVETKSAQVAEKTVIHLEPKQEGSGDPSPDNVRPITGWTACEISTSGKNLFNPVRTSGSGGSGNMRAFIKCKPGDKFVIKRFGEAIPSSLLCGECVCGWRDANNIDTRIGEVRYWENNDYKNEVTVIMPEGAEYLFIGGYSSRGLQDYVLNNAVQLVVQKDTVPTEFIPFIGATYPITFPTEAGTVYSGTLTIEKDGSGTLVVETAEIASYNGETLPGVWISDRDVYSSEAVPTTGAQVVYYLAAPITYTLTAEQVSLLKGINHIFTDGASLDLTYRKGAFATLEDVHDITESSEDASIYHLGFCIKDGKLCQIYYKEEE